MQTAHALVAQCLVAGFLAAMLAGGDRAAPQPAKPCQDQLRYVEQQLPLITEEVTRDAVVALWKEADSARQNGDESTCKAKLAEAMEKANIRPEEG